VSNFIFSSAVLDWFDQHGRKNLPWQKNISPYRVWVSEIMLQQTQVNTVIPYFDRFMQRFPDVSSLAQAKEDDVLHLWTGLGYYARARNLHKTAQLVHQQHNNNFPNSQDGLESLPGIGRSTAGAILSLSMHTRAPILDGNVKRVLSRFNCIEGWSGQSKTLKTLWQLAEQLTPDQRVADYTQAMMDLGATLCTRSQPQCARCPLQQDCKAFQQDCVKNYPQPKPKKQLPTRNAFFLILVNEDGHVLLEKRPAQGIWGGLWSLPQQEDKTLLIDNLQQSLQVQIQVTGSLPEIRHTFSHFHLTMQPILAKLHNAPMQINDAGQRGWYQPQQLTGIGLATPIKNLLSNL